MQQGRWVSYIFRYRNNLRCDNAGFIKVQRISSEYKVILSNVKSQQKHIDRARIQIGIKMYKEYPVSCKMYLIHRPEGMTKPSVTYLEEIRFNAKERDTIVKKMEFEWDNPLGENKSFDAYDGIYFICDDGDVLVGMWNEYALDLEQIHVEEVRREQISEKHELGKQTQKEKAKIREEKRQEQIPERETEENICQKMLATFPKLPLFDDSQFVECVKIVPHDIGKLAISNWKLGVNSFLSHGYYHYRYIMLGKVKFERKEAYVIGVPGVYTNKEKYLANMFGFNIFIPVRRTKLLTGNFGYWISEILTE